MTMEIPAGFARARACKAGGIALQCSENFLSLPTIPENAYKERIMQITYTAFGGAREVTGSKHMLTIGNQKILMDCGMFQGHREESDQRNRMLPFNAKDLAAVILSHGHFDHCGNMPTLINQGYTGNIYATDGTRDIANLIMMDAAHIMAKDYEWLLSKGRKAYKPIYNERDVVEAIDHFITLGYKRPLHITDKATLEFYNAGHILGSSVVFLRLNDNGAEKTIAFSGDLGRPGAAIIKPADPIPTPDYLLLESTYGNRLHDPIENAGQEMAQVINETIAQGGKIIIPSFAVGRTQELIYFLHLLKDSKAIPNDLPVYVDSPMAVNATSIFQVHQECYNEAVRQQFIDHHENPFGFNGLNYISDVKQSMAINEQPGSCIIISSSGMCEAGRILHHLKNNIGSAKNTILIVGYMAQNTLGRALADKLPVVKIFGNEYVRKARVKILNTFSGHADYNDLLNYVKKLDLGKLKKIYLVHGEGDAQANLQKLLLQAGVKSVDIVEPEQEYRLFGT